MPSAYGLVRRMRSLAVLAALVLLVSAGCAHVPAGRYGVDELELAGVEQLDPYALRACLATRERPSLSIDLSKEPAPTCGKPPFDAQRIHAPLFRWPWTDWPLYDPSVFERDLSRIERWYRARGFYGIRLTAAASDPPEALYGTPSDKTNEVKLTVKLEEGKPVLIRSVSLSGTADLDQDVGAMLLTQLDTLTPDMRFDEATFDLTKHTLIRTLHDAGYPSAAVDGRVDVDPVGRTADITMTVKSGPFSEFGNVCVEGHEKLPAKLILQASDIAPGRPFSETDLEDARTRIYQMRVFSEVEIIAGRTDPKTGASQFNADGSAPREGEFVALENDEARALEDEDDGASERVCRLSKRKSKRPQIPIEIRVKPGKLYRFGVGAGIQIGVEDGQRAVNAAQQWDVHLFSYVEVRNFIGGLRRLRLEERPRLVFPAAFPRVKPTDDSDPDIRLGNNLSALLEWPAFLEPRTLLRVTATWDRGPDPYGGGFIRDDIDAGIGPSRSFFKNRLHASLMAHFNPYIPQEVYGDETPDSVLKDERYYLLFLQQTVEWDQRDDRSSPRMGRYIRLEVHESLPPSNWDYVRVAPELREYFPLPYGLVLATRAGFGVIHIYDTDKGESTPGLEELKRLGPRPYRLRGGGPYSVRGVQAGALGLRDTDTNGFPGGTRSWIASVELRVPLGDSFGIATFVDAGDVDGGSASEKARFRFDHPNTTLGAGLRYKTIVGPVRLDAGFLVPGLGGDRSDAREVDRRDPLFRFNGAVHLTIGEAF
jgi:outer membrane translocation and assembly module TamA